MTALFTANFVTSLIFGLGFLLIPSTMLGSYQVSVSEELVFMTRMFGISLLSVAVIMWYVRRSDNQAFINAAARSSFLYWILSPIFFVFAQLAGMFNYMGWVTIGFHVFFALWYAYKLFIRP